AGWGKGRAPDWMIDGAASVLAARLHPDHDALTDWKQELPTAARSLSRPDDFMTGRSNPETSSVLSHGFAEAMLRKPRDFAKLMDEIAGGTPPDRAITDAYGRSPEELARVWVAAVSRQR
ncbi:MAG: hypothetical protein AAGG46_09545, partial [Planctomycetota bacterium]